MALMIIMTKRASAYLLFSQCHKNHFRRSYRNSYPQSHTNDMSNTLKITTPVSEFIRRTIIRMSYNVCRRGYR